MALLEAGNTVLWAVPALCHVSSNPPSQRCPGLILEDVIVPFDTTDRACGQCVAAEHCTRPQPFPACLLVLGSSGLVKLLH